MDNNQPYSVKINVDLFIKVKARAGNDAEYSAMQIIVDKLLKAGVVYKIDPRVVSSELIQEEINDGKH